MKISFDLDDTIIPGSRQFETEKRSFILRIFKTEKIRKGTIDLFKTLRKNNHSIGIYTTSMRNARKVRFMFRLYGIPVDFVINYQKHQSQKGSAQNYPSKFPSRFGIDIHIDDSDGVAMEGEKYGFRTIIVKEGEEDWVKFVLGKLENA